MLTATTLGQKFELSARRINQILSEHGWIKRHVKGWLVTPMGQRVGGEQREDNKSGIPFVLWPPSVTDNPSLKNTIEELKGDTKEAKEFPVNAPSADKSSGFRDKMKPKLRTADGHFVRSRAEMLIDNWLYTARLSTPMNAACRSRRRSTATFIYRPARSISSSGAWRAMRNTANEKNRKSLFMNSTASV